MIKVIKNPFVGVKWNDPRFMMSNGIYNSGAAGIEISKDCPDRYKLMIMDAFQRGWIVPFTVIKEEIEYNI